MSTDYVNFDQVKENDKESLLVPHEELPQDEFHIDENTTYKALISELIYLASPIIFMYVTHMIWSTLIYTNVASRPLYITEGKSIIFIYYYTLIIGFVWGFSIGFEIKGSRAYGALDYNEIYKLISSIFTIFFYLCLAMMILSNTLVPYLLSFLPFDSQAVENFKSEMLLLSLTFPMIIIICILGRLSNMLQRNHILNYATLVSLIVQVFASYLFMNYLEMDSYGMGCTFLCTYTSKLIVILRDFVIEKPQGINIMKIQFMNIFSDYVLENFYFSIFPCLNVLVMLLSGELNSYLGLLINDLVFTTLCIYFNVFSIVSLLFEAMANSMTILVSYSIGKDNHPLAWRVWKAALRIVFPSALVISLIIYIFSEQLFSLYSQDIDFQRLAVKYSDLLCLSLFLAGIHYVLSEFIITCGYMKFPFIVSLIMRFGFHMTLTPIVILKYGYGIEVILINWVVAQVASVLIFIVKIYFIHRNGINVIKKKE